MTVETETESALASVSQQPFPVTQTLSGQVNVMLPGHSMVPQHILQQLCICKVDDPEDGSKALVSDGGAGRRAVHFVENPKQSFDKALCQLGVLLHQLGSCIFSADLLVAPCRHTHRAGQLSSVPPPTCR